MVLATYRCVLPGLYRLGYIEIASVSLRLRGRFREKKRRLRRNRTACLSCPSRCFAAQQFFHREFEVRGHVSEIRPADLTGAQEVTNGATAGVELPAELIVVEHVQLDEVQHGLHSFRASDGSRDLSAACRFRRCTVRNAWCRHSTAKGLDQIDPYVKPGIRKFDDLGQCVYASLSSCPDCVCRVSSRYQNDWIRRLL